MRKIKDKRGFTLVEVLVAGGVSLLLGLVIVNVFIQSRRSLDHALGTADLVRATRPVLDRMGYYLAAGSSIPSQDTVLWPVHDPANNPLGMTNERGQTVLRNEPSTWTRYVVFRTTEDFLSPTFDPNQIMSLTTMTSASHQTLMDLYKTDSQDVFDYIVWYEGDSADPSQLNVLPTEDNVLAVARVAQLVDGSGNTVYRTNDWASIPAGNNPFNDLEPAYAPRIIARGVDDVSFYRENFAISVSAEASAEVRNATGTNTKQFRANSTIHIPSGLLSSS